MMDLGIACQDCGLTDGWVCSNCEENELDFTKERFAATCAELEVLRGKMKRILKWVNSASYYPTMEEEIRLIAGDALFAAVEKETA